ncbi:hypothetical protein [Nocardiopsis sp. NPDC057823]|uniref:hypothetical protein n=1 Tax=Nocardiopsis sp. NPDC057823 TaxID=3346256 RepID=UPI00366A9E5D
MAIKRSRKAYAVPVEGRVRVVPAGTLMEESDPRYRERAGRFEDVGNYVDRTTRPPRRVEAATAEPGELRDVAPTPEESAGADDTTPDPSDGESDDTTVPVQEPESAETEDDTPDPSDGEPKTQAASSARRRTRRSGGQK